MKCSEMFYQSAIQMWGETEARIRLRGIFRQRLFFNYSRQVTLPPNVYLLDSCMKFYGDKDLMRYLCTIVRNIRINHKRGMK